jgi:Tfp pilus assembly protein PilE
MFNKKAFTAAQLILVIVLIGALALFSAPKLTRLMERRRTVEAEEMLSTIRAEQERRCQAGSGYETNQAQFPILTNAQTGSNFTYSLQEVGATATRIGKDYEIKMLSYKTGRLCCSGSGCEALGKNYMTCTPEAAQAALKDECAGEGACDAQDRPNETQACRVGKGEETRSVYCYAGEWKIGEWDDSGCGCFAEDKPISVQRCFAGAGKETRSVTCDPETNAWVAGDWDISDCTCDPKAKPIKKRSCTSGVGTETRTVKCNEDTNVWVVSAWDKSACTCDETYKPKATASCAPDVGEKTRRVVCDGTTWLVSSWNTSACKPDVKGCRGIKAGVQNCSWQKNKDGGYSERICPVAGGNPALCIVNNYDSDGKNLSGYSCTMDSPDGVCVADVVYIMNGKNFYGYPCDATQADGTCRSYNRNSPYRQIQLYGNGGRRLLHEFRNNKRVFEYDGKGNLVSDKHCAVYDYVNMSCKKYSTSSLPAKAASIYTFDNNGYIKSYRSCNTAADGNCATYTNSGYDVVTVNGKLYQKACSAAEAAGEYGSCTGALTPTTPTLALNKQKNSVYTAVSDERGVTGYVRREVSGNTVTEWYSVSKGTWGQDAWLWGKCTKSNTNADGSCKSYNGTEVYYVHSPSGAEFGYCTADEGCVTSSGHLWYDTY